MGRRSGLWWACRKAYHAASGARDAPTGGNPMRSFGLRTAPVAILLLALLALAVAAGNNPGHAATERPAMVLRHVVFFKFKPEATVADIRAVEQAFCALPSKIGAIRDFEWGTDVSVENLHKGFTHCFQVTFETEADRANYLPHPDHEAFTKIAGPVLDDVIVLDYWTRP
jgi:hypothetical protein